MEITAIIILVALLQYIYFTGRVGFSRGKYEVSAPSVSGNENWERLLRVQQNTFEQLIIFIPGMLTFTTYVSSFWAIVPGIVFIIGRQIYSYQYVNEPKSRSPGFALTFFSNLALVVGSLIGLAMKMI